MQSDNHPITKSRNHAMIITLLTDFGTQDTYVGVMKGVMLGICPAARLVDLTHAVPPQAVAVGAWLLRGAVDSFAAGTTHLAVVDPGVGSGRAPVAVVTPAGCLVGPDNGLLYPAAVHLGVLEVRRLENPRFFRTPVSQTFHGRDIFAPVAAHLAAGVPPSELGPRRPGLQPLALAEPVRRGDTITGAVIYIDRFGNLVTNIPAAALADYAIRGLSVSIAGVQVDVAELSPSYAAVAEHAALAIIGSWGLLELAVRDGNAAAAWGVGAGASVAVTPR
jgi:hypothetical protein